MKIGIWYLNIFLAILLLWCLSRKKTKEVVSEISDRRYTLGLKDLVDVGQLRSQIQILEQKYLLLEENHANSKMRDHEIIKTLEQQLEHKTQEIQDLIQGHKILEQSRMADYQQVYQELLALQHRLSQIIEAI